MRFPGRMDRTAPLAAPLDEIAALVERGFVRRLWIWCIDARGGLRRDLQQVDGIPVSPDAGAARALRGVLELVLQDARAVVVVLERAGSAEPTPDDWAWRDAIERAARGAAVPVRGVLLAHGCGVDELAPVR